MGMTKEKVKLTKEDIEKIFVAMSEAVSNSNIAVNQLAKAFKESSEAVVGLGISIADVQAFIKAYERVS